MARFPPGFCKVCDNPARSEIDKALLEEKESLAAIAARHDFSRQTLAYHRKAHLATALAERPETPAERRIANGRRSAHNILEELSECFEDCWRLRGIVRKQLEAMEQGCEFDPVPLRILCDTIAQVRATCQVAVNVNHLAIEGERLRMEQEVRAAGEADALQQLFATTLGDVLAGDLCESLVEAGVPADVAGAAAEETAPRLLARIVSRFSEENTS